MSRTNKYAVLERLLDKEVKSLTTRKVNELQSGKELREVFKMKIHNREVSILPYYVNMLTLSIENNIKNQINSYARKNMVELSDFDVEEAKKIIGKEEYTVLTCLVGTTDAHINKVRTMFYMKDAENFIKSAIDTIKTELVCYSFGNRNILDLSDKCENTMGMSYIICLKWLTENIELPSMLINSKKRIDDKLEEILNGNSFTKYFDGELGTTELDRERFIMTGYRNYDAYVKLEGNTEKLLCEVVIEIAGIMGLGDMSVTDSETYYQMLNKIDLAKSVYAKDLGISVHTYNSAILGDTKLSSLMADSKREIDKLKEKNERIDKDMSELTKENKDMKKELKAYNKENNELQAENTKLKEELDKLYNQENPKLAECEKEKQRLTESMEKLNNEISTYKDSDVSLKSEIESLHEKIRGMKEDSKSKKSQIAELESTVNELLDIIDKYEDSNNENIAQDELTDEMLESIINQKILVVGGRGNTIESSISDKGFNVKQLNIFEHTVFSTAMDFGDFDTLVVITSHVKHNLANTAIDYAKSSGRNVVRVPFTNVDRILMEIYNVTIKESEECDIHD